jgi:hypothetical protein
MRRACARDWRAPYGVRNDDEASICNRRSAAPILIRALKIAVRIGDVSHRPIAAGCGLKLMN